MKPKFYFTLSIIILGMLLTACQFSASNPTATSDTNTIQTQVAATVIADRTKTAGEQASAHLTEIAKATPTATSPLAPTQTTQPTATEVPPTATQTQAPTATLVPSPTATSIPPTPVPPTPVPPTPVPPVPTAKPVPCNWALLVKDISTPDGTVVIAGSDFTKTWRLENIGTCHWTSKYALVYTSGEQMGADKVTYLDETIEPGETVDISLTFTAPSAEGSHIGYWKLRNQNGAYFGTGDNADQALWVMIKVANPSGVAYNFTNHICEAFWRTKDGQIPCTPPISNLWDMPKTETDSYMIVQAGSVERVDSPKLETGRKEDEVAIVVHPNDGDGGYISGKFPQRKIQAGDWFRTVIGCMYDNPKCNVTFKLEYQIDGGKLQTLGTWKQKYDESIQNVDIDLSFLAGKRVVFILTVQNNGSSEGDYAFWLFPRIAR